MILSNSRRLLAGLVAAAVAGAMLVNPPAAAADEAFYVPPSPLPSGSPGDVIKTQPAFMLGAKVTRIMYLSRDIDGAPMPVTGLVLVPSRAWSGPGARPVVGYSPFTVGAADKCAPSKTLVGEGSGDLTTPFQTGYVNSMLDKGMAVALTDYQGMGTPGDHTYVMREPTAHAVLDVIRAAQRLPDSGLPADGPVAVTGYSQGGGGAAAAAELAPSYAPDLNLVAAYSGAPPADLPVLAERLEGHYAAGFLGFSMIGANAAYPELRIIEDLANDRGKEVFERLRGSCTIEAIFNSPFTRTADLTVDGRSLGEYLAVEPYRTVADEQKIGNGKPAVPVMVEHAPNDDIVPYEQGRQMAMDWCARGVSVRFNDINVPLEPLSHTTAMPAAGVNSANYLADRFAGKPAPSNCGAF